MRGSLTRHEAPSLRRRKVSHLEGATGVPPDRSGTRASNLANARKEFREARARARKLVIAQQLDVERGRSGPRWTAFVSAVRRREPRPALGQARTLSRREARGGGGVQVRCAPP